MEKNKLTKNLKNYSFLLTYIFRASITMSAMAVIIGTFFVKDPTSELQTDDNNNMINHNLRKFFICFSFTANSKKLFTITENDSKNNENELKFLHGLRVLSILWVILCHTTNFAPLGLYDQPLIAGNFKFRIKSFKLKFFCLNLSNL
jgi:hypothetical protein